MPRINWKIISVLLVSLALIACTSENPANEPSSAGATDDSGRTLEADSEIPVAEESGSSSVERPVEEPASAAAVLDGFYTEDSDSGDVLTALEEAGVEDMDEESRLVYAVVLRNNGRLDESRDQLQKLVDDDHLFADAWFNLALLEHSAGNDDKRDSALDKALEADPTLAEAHAFRGSLAIAASQWEQAEASLKKSLQYDPENVESLVGQAWVYAKTDRLEEGLPFLDYAIELEPDYVYARVDRSRVYVSLQKYNEAEDDLDIAIELEPEIPWHYLDRARIRLRYFKEYEGALADLEKVEELDPGNFFALVYLAGLHDEERRFSKSMNYYQQVVEARPDYVWSYMPLGKFAWMEGRFEDSAKWYAKAAVEDPDEFSYALMTALSLARIGQKDRGDKILKDLIRKYESNEVEYNVIRFCLERSSDFYAVNALNKEQNVALRERLWFYMGAIYDSEGNEIGSDSVYERLALRTGEAEYDISYAAINGMDG